MKIEIVVDPSKAPPTSLASRVAPAPAPPVAAAVESVPRFANIVSTALIHVPYQFYSGLAVAHAVVGAMVAARVASARRRLLRILMPRWRWVVLCHVSGSSTATSLRRTTLPTMPPPLLLEGQVFILSLLVDLFSQKISLLVSLRTRWFPLLRLSIHSPSTMYCILP